MKKKLFFAFYKYHLSKVKTELQMDWDDGMPRPQNYPTLEDYFEALLPAKGQELQVWDKARRASTLLSGSQPAERDMVRQRDMKDYHRADIVEHKDHIIVFTIQTNATKRIIDQNNVTRTEKHYPSSYVIIDNRPGHQLIAIEVTHRDSVMDKDRAARLLLSHFNSLMPLVGVQIEITQLLRQQDFYEAVQTILNTMNDTVCKLEFNFPTDGQQSRLREPEVAAIRAFMDYISGFGYRGSFSAYVRGNREFMSRKMRKTWELLAQECLRNNGYFLRVRFERTGWFQYGQELIAQFGISKEVIDRFAGKLVDTGDSDIFIDEEDQVPEKFTPLRELLDDKCLLLAQYEERKISKRKSRRRHPNQVRT